MPRPPPDPAGVSASRLQLPPGHWATLLDGLCARFPAIPRERWLGRFARGRVLDGSGRMLESGTPYRVGTEVYYFREVEDESRIAAQEVVLHADDRLVVADKPHGLPVTPAGDRVADTLLARLVRRLGNPRLVPLHRLDRDTAGLVLFSVDPRTRDRYHALFRQRSISKQYEALAPPLPGLDFPCVHRSRLLRGQPFFRMQEVPGEPNSETRIEVQARGDQAWRYALQPVTGRKHQLRVHMAALGAPILGDALYPSLRDANSIAPPTQLQLLATRLSFVDPLDGRQREFVSTLALGDGETA
ncbi:MAG: pseudouridine synthase [Pseudomonadota bacterium]|nr:pseudouridine synthase [Pseudomonadota bacterium]